MHSRFYNLSERYWTRLKYQVSLISRVIVLVPVFNASLIASGVHRVTIRTSSDSDWAIQRSDS